MPRANYRESSFLWLHQSFCIFTAHFCNRPETYRHSHRVYSYGRAIASQCFPSWNLTPGSKLDETWYLTAMLHDIGTADEFIHSTRLSFEFWGGYHALDILQHPSSSNSAPQTGDHSSTSAPRSQAESVAEAIIRHQDIQPAGYVSLMTRLIHLGTLMDNVGASTDLVNPKTIENVVQEYDRKGWSGCFESTLKKEKSIKPYTMVSRIEGFEGKISAHGAKMGD